MSADEKKQPRKYTETIETHFQGQDNVMPERLTFFNCTQKQGETITDYEQRIRTIAKKTKFEYMTNSLQELWKGWKCQLTSVVI